MKTQLTLFLLSHLVCSQVAADGNYLQTLLGSLVNYDGEEDGSYNAVFASSVGSETGKDFQDFSDIDDSDSEVDHQVDLHAHAMEDSIIVSGVAENREAQRSLKKAKAPVGPKAQKRRARVLKKAKAPVAPKAPKMRARVLKKAKAPVAPKAPKMRARALKKAKAPVAPKAPKRRARVLKKAKAPVAPKAPKRRTRV